MKTLLTSILAFLWVLFGYSQTTWYQVPTNTSKQLNTINFGSDLVGYIGGNDSLILKTTDGGLNWTELNYTGVSFTPGGEHIMNLKFVSETVGYMTVGPYTGTYMTIDGGLTWTQVTFAGNMCYNYGLYFFGQGNGFVGGSGCFQGEHIERSAFGVFAESTINTPSWNAQDMVVDIDFDLDQFGAFGLAVSAGGRILRTTDGGDTWDTIPSGQTLGTPLTSVEIINDTVAYAGYDDPGNGFGILKTIDAGLTWFEDINSATFYYPAYHDVHENNSGHVYAGGEPSMSTAGLIFEDKGNGWMYYDVDHIIYQLDSYGDSIVFAVGDSGYVVVNVPLGTLGFKDDLQNYAPTKIFPNPANDILNIDLNAELKSYSVYAVSGQVIEDAKIVNSQLDISDWNTGFYLMQLNYSERTETLRFIKE